MKVTTWAVVALTLVVGAVLAANGLLLALLTIAGGAATVWLLARAASAEPPPGSLPPGATAAASDPPTSDGERLRDVAAVARALPRHLVADADAVQRLSERPVPSAGPGMARFAADLGEAVGR